jgi:hypothetical protein
MLTVVINNNNNNNNKTLLYCAIFPQSGINLLFHTINQRVGTLHWKVIMRWNIDLESCFGE